MSAPIVSRGPVGLIAAVFAGGLSAAFLLTALLHPDTALIFLAYFAAMPLYLAGLGAGSVAGIVATVTGAVVLYLTHPNNFAVLYAIAYGIPAILLTGLALRYRLAQDDSVNWYPEGKLLTAITLYPCILFLTAAAVATTHPGGLLDIIQNAFDQIANQLIDTFRQTQADTFDEQHVEALRSMIAGIAKIAPALLAYTWILVAILSIAGAHYILRQQKWNLRVTFSIQTLYVPVALIYGVAVTGLIGALAPAPFDFVGRNLALILGLPFLFVGIAVTHALVARAKRPGLILFLFYAVMTLLPWMMLLIAGLGIIDQWVDFRKRIASKPTV
jgi:uncharacterized protein YybS (DUF2232 family)